MAEAELIALNLDKHQMQCPHCKNQTVHHSPGEMILFATVKCVHCGGGFLVAMDKSHLAER
jgi:transposase-like protein